MREGGLEEGKVEAFSYDGSTFFDGVTPQKRLATDGWMNEC
jgi:hypothetical protein